MKHFTWLALLALTLTTGCLNRYKMTMTNQHVITTHGRPKVDEKNSVVRFKDAEGNQRTVPLFTVKQIEPY